MAIFRTEIKIVKDSDKEEVMFNNRLKEEYMKRFIEMNDQKFYQYIYSSRTDNIVEIELSKDEWLKIKSLMPYKIYEIDEEIIVRKDMLCFTNRYANIGFSFNDMTKSFLPDSCEAYIIETEDKVFLRPIKNDGEYPPCKNCEIRTSSYINTFIARMIQYSVVTQPEFYEPIIKPFKPSMKG